MITTTKVTNPYGVTFDLSSDRDGFMCGNISIDGIVYPLQAISWDIVECLIEVTDDSLRGIITATKPIAFKTVDDLPEELRKEALKVKLKLMACNTFQEMDKANKAKLSVIEKYYNLRQREQKRHFDQMNEIELWLKEELEKIDE